MANQYSDLYSRLQDSTTYVGRAPVCEKKGDQVYIAGTATITTNLGTTGDKVYLFPIQKGARVISFVHEWGDLDSSTNLTMDLGYLSTNPDAILPTATSTSQYQAADTTVASGGGSNSITEVLQEAMHDEAVTTAADDVGFTVVVGATSLAATRTIVFKAIVAMP